MADGYLLSENSARKLAGLLGSSPRASGMPSMSVNTFRDGAPAPIVVNNTSGAIIPAYAVMQPHGYLEQSGKALIKVKKWDGSYPGPFLFNSDNAIEVAGNGTAQLGPQYRCFYKSGYVPAAGDFAGPVSGQWYIDTGVPLMTVYGILDSVARTLTAIMEVPKMIQIAGPSGGIPAASDYTAGSATCKLLRYAAGVIKDTGKTLTVKNYANSIVLANGYRLGTASPVDMVWEAVSENCGDVRTYSAPASL